MEAEILESITRLFRSYVIDAVLYALLVLAAVAVTVGVLKFNLIKRKAGKVALVVLMAVCTLGMIAIQTMETIPVYRDYSEQSYVLVEDAEMVIKDGASGTPFNSTNRVVLIIDGQETELKMQTDYALDTEKVYHGSVAYLEHSGYVVWYAFEE